MQAQPRFGQPALQQCGVCLGWQILRQTLASGGLGMKRLPLFQQRELAAAIAAIDSVEWL